MRRRFHMVESTGNERVSIRIADEKGKVVCTLPPDEHRLAKLILFVANALGSVLRPYDKHDWWMERNVDITLRLR